VFEKMSFFVVKNWLEQFLSNLRQFQVVGDSVLHHFSDRLIINRDRTWFKLTEVWRFFSSKSSCASLNEGFSPQEEDDILKPLIVQHSVSAS